MLGRWRACRRAVPPGRSRATFFAQGWWKSPTRITSPNPNKLEPHPWQYFRLRRDPIRIRRKHHCDLQLPRTGLLDSHRDDRISSYWDPFVRLPLR